MVIGILDAHDTEGTGVCQRGLETYQAPDVIDETQPFDIATGDGTGLFDSVFDSGFMEASTPFTEPLPFPTP